MNIASFMVTPNFIVRSESADPLPSFLEDAQISVVHQQTDELRERIARLIGSSEADAIRRLYANDFRFFGYSEDPSVIAPIGPCTPPPVERHVLKSLMILEARKCTWRQPGSWRHPLMLVRR
jgi:hypothetical protein